MSLDRTRLLMRCVMAIFYGAAGVIHLRFPDAFLPIVPDWVPWPHDVILSTGLCELAGAIALLVSPFRWWGGALLALYAICVFPANIKHAVDNVMIMGMHQSWWYHLPRLAFQPILVWWALFCGRVTDWPLKARERSSVLRNGPQSR
jgi:uncharacterized membrane protein